MLYATANMVLVGELFLPLGIRYHPLQHIATPPIPMLTSWRLCGS